MTKKLSGKEYRLHEALVKTVNTAKQSFVIMGRLLYELKADNNFKKAVGNDVETWEEYLAMPEVGLSGSEANRLMQIYEEFCLRLGINEDWISEAPLKNIHYILPQIKRVDREEAEELLQKAISLSRSDLKKELDDMKLTPEERTYTYMVMAKCDQTGSLTKIRDVDSEDIEDIFSQQIKSFINEN